MANAFKCDICGKFYEGKGTEALAFVEDREKWEESFKASYIKSHLDLCPVCIKELGDYISNKQDAIILYHGYCNHCYWYYHKDGNGERCRNCKKQAPTSFSPNIPSASSQEKPST